MYILGTAIDTWKQDELKLLPPHPMMNGEFINKQTDLLTSMDGEEIRLIKGGVKNKRICVDDGTESNFDNKKKMITADVDEKDCEDVNEIGN